MASYLRPRRGAYSAISSTTLTSGEIFFETPNGIGGGKGRIMMGNGSNTYAQLAGSSKYFLDIDSSPVSYSNITGSSGSAFTNYSALAASLGSGTVTLPTIARVLKRALYDLQATFTKLNNDMVSKPLMNSSPAYLFSQYATSPPETKSQTVDLTNYTFLMFIVVYGNNGKEYVFAPKQFFVNSATSEDSAFNLYWGEYIFVIYYNSGKIYVKFANGAYMKLDVYGW